MTEENRNHTLEQERRERERVDAGRSGEVDSGPGLSGGYGADDDPEETGDDSA